MHAFCRRDGRTISVNCEVFSTGFCKMAVTLVAMDVIPLKDTRNPDICVNELNRFCACCTALCCAQVYSGIYF